MNQDIQKQLNKIEKNTEATLHAMQTKNEDLVDNSNQLEEKEEKRKEQNRESQKKYKTIGFKAREEIFDTFDTFAKEEMGMSSVSAMCRQYFTLLFENREFQTQFKEFQILQKNDEKHKQISFFLKETEYKKYEENAEENAYTLSSFTQKAMFEIMSDNNLKNEIINLINKRESADFEDTNIKECK
ncbi:MAG: hypothetical protein U9Q83_01745 [Bacteroidota bacterium]|nr:hypothetical protein [Bacteroidota bacterium]